ncbi:MAG: hypothetical protein QM532_01330 [Cyanobium sp. MAG06]|nr:hypothetical protein [Cyanobium sp. MAG06]
MTSVSQLLTFNLGSNLITEPAKVNIVELKADLRNSNGVNTPNGSVTATINTGSSYARTTKTSQSVTVSAQASKTLTVGGVSANVSKTTGFLAKSVSPNTTGVVIGSVTLSNDDNEDVSVNNVSFAITTNTLGTAQNISNVRLATSSSNIYSPLSAAAGTYNFSTNDTVVRNSSRVYEVLADIGSVDNNSTVVAVGNISYRGVVSNVNTTSANTSSATITFNAGTLAAPAKSSDSLSSRALTGTASKSVAKFTLKANSGTVNVNEL